ncbi:MAG TPA: ABC transporter permease subunit [Thermotogota bacterium]|nr:ABC transporter permease subunit [Thermotogota bacterium]
MKVAVLSKWVFLLVVNVLLLAVSIFLFSFGSEGLAIVTLMLLALIDFAVINPKGYPYRYTIPAMFFLLFLTVYPVYFTIKTAFTNYGTGHLLSREQVVEALLQEYVSKPGVEPFSYRVFIKMEDFKPTDKFLLLFSRNGELYLSSPPVVETRDSKGNVMRAVGNYEKVVQDQCILEGETYRIIHSFKNPEELLAIERVRGAGSEKFTYFFSFDDPATLPNQRFFISNIYLNYLSGAEWLNPLLPTVRFGSQYGFRKIVEAERKYRLDTLTVPENGEVVTKTVFINTDTGNMLDERDGFFYDRDASGKLITVAGYTSFVGLKNFTQMLGDPRLSRPFLRIFWWTLTWATLSVLFSFTIGLGLALMLNEKGLAGKTFYRTLLILPWAIPSFISVLVWRNGFFNETYGIMNKIILGQWFGIDPVRWLGDPFWAKAACLIVNTWLGFPYMMTVSLGALQSIPAELYEAASMDGAGPVRRFRKITLPLLMTSVAPLLVGSFAFNFNNFVGIYLLTQGGPEMPNSITNAGSTDILISYTYKLAFEGSRGQNFGYAAAITLFIFLMVVGISAINFKISGTFEEVNR